MSRNHSKSIGYIEEELLHDPGDVQSWNISENGGDGWLVETDGRFEKCFLSSYEWCRKSQKIDLKALGYSDEFLDSSPEIVVSDFYKGRRDCGSVYELRVELRDNQNRLLQNPYVFSAETVPKWTPVIKRFSDYGPGLRFIFFQHSGKDRNWWKGYFGAKVAGSSVVLTFSFNHLVELSPKRSLTTTALAKCDQIEMKRAILNLISRWKIPSIDLIRTTEESITNQNKEFRKDAPQLGFTDPAQARSLRVDLQWVNNGRASIAVLCGYVVYANIIVPVRHPLGVRLFRTLLNRSLEACAGIEFIRNDDGFQANKNARILISDITTRVSWIVLLHASPLQMIGVWRDAK